MQRRAMLLLAAMLVALVAVGGVALAATIDGTRGDDRIRGTNNRDKIDARGGQDVVFARRSADVVDGAAGDDTLWAGPRNESARDTVSGGKGDDDIHVFNRPAARDVVSCGSGFDRVFADSRDLFTGCNRIIHRR